MKKLKLVFTLLPLLCLLFSNAKAQNNTLDDEDFATTSIEPSDTEDPIEWKGANGSPNGTGGTYIYSKPGRTCMLNVLKEYMCGPYSTRIHIYNFRTVKTSGYKSISVSWAGKNSGTQPINLYYSVNGIDFNEVTGWTDAGNAWSTRTAILPPAAENKSNVSLRWVYSGTGEYSMDDIIVKGDVDPLPVTLVSFAGLSLKGSNILNWATATEINNNYFEIQKSTDGKQFSTIGKVMGNGNSSILRTYSFTDYSTNGGTSYYRLKQVDYDGTSELSKVVSVKNNYLSKVEVMAYPNPASKDMKVVLNGFAGSLVSYRILDFSGKEVKVGQVLECEPEFSLPVSELAVGSYLLQVSNSEHNKVIRFLKD